ncbi:MAG TPA: hypothetical protein VNO31_15550, partial [Umezawaea sp.]|nr:hypothetical protein [Umezawaea sp.]
IAVNGMLTSGRTSRRSFGGGRPPRLRQHGTRAEFTSRRRLSSDMSLLRFAGGVRRSRGA